MIWLRLIPAWAYWLVAVVALGVVLNVQGRVAGAAKVQLAWDAEKLAAENQAEVLRLSRQSAINKSANDFAAKAAKDRVTTKIIIREVEKYVPNTLPLLPPDFRLYYDAAVAGAAIDDSRRADASPVAPRTVAENAAGNYASCRYDQERLEALQGVVRVLNGQSE